jgi:uncharacterized protein
MSEANLQIVQRGYQAFGENDIEGMLEQMDVNIHWEVRMLPGIPLHGVYKGHAGVRDFKARLANEVEVIEFVPQNFIEGDDKVVVIGYERSIVKANGKEVLNKWVHVFTVQNGKVTEFQGSNDVAAIKDAYEI